MIAFGMFSWWKSSAGLGIAMLLASPRMLFPMYISLEVWLVKKGFIVGHGDILWTIVILATSASGIAGGPSDGGLLARDQR